MLNPDEASTGRALTGRVAITARMLGSGMCCGDRRSTMPPTTPTPKTYSQPCMKSNKCECAREDTTFSTTTTVPTQAIHPAVEQKIMRGPLASSTAAPTRPSCIATPNIWLCGLTVATPAAPFCSIAERRNRSAMEPVPWPMSGASRTNLSDFLKIRGVLRSSCQPRGAVGSCLLNRH